MLVISKNTNRVAITVEARSRVYEFLVDLDAPVARKPLRQHHVVVDTDVVQPHATGDNRCPTVHAALEGPPEHTPTPHKHTERALDRHADRRLLVVVRICPNAHVRSRSRDGRHHVLTITVRGIAVKPCPIRQQALLELHAKIRRSVGEAVARARREGYVDVCELADRVASGLCVQAVTLLAGAKETPWLAVFFVGRAARLDYDAVNRADTPLHDLISRLRARTRVRYKSQRATRANKTHISTESRLQVSERFSVAKRERELPRFVVVHSINHFPDGFVHLFFGNLVQTVNVMQTPTREPA